MIEQDTAKKVQSGTEEFELEAEKRFGKIAERRSEIEGEVLKLQVELEDIQVTIGNLQEDGRRIEEEFLNVQSEEEFDDMLKLLTDKAAELSAVYEKNDQMWFVQSTLYNEMYGLDEEGVLLGMKNRSDYLAGYIKGLNEESAKVAKEVEAAKGKEDEDIVTAQVAAITAWYAQEVTRLTPEAADALE